jgi:3',5'-cyclic AMP phosphodiesterase CpdA
VIERLVLVAQISDLHVKRPGEIAYGHVDTATALSRCVEELNRFRPRLSMVVISGDLVDTPTAEEYDHLKILLASLEIPFLAIPGNHDERTLMRAALPDQPYAQSSGALNIVSRCGDLDLVLIDSSVPSEPYGELDTTTLTWLEGTLAASRTRPALVFLHHPPFITGIDHMDRQNLRNAPELATVLLRHERAQLVAAGHVHRATLAMFAGIPATICPAPNHAVALDLEPTYPPSFKIEPPGFHLHAWFSGNHHGRVVTHFVPIGDFNGPYPFHSSEGGLL